MLLAAIHLLFHAFDTTISEMGTSAIALGVGLLYYAVKIIRAYRRAGWVEVRKEWIGDAGWGVALTLGAWMLLFAYSVIATIYQDHKHFVNEAHALGTKLESERTQSAQELNTETQRLQAEITNVKTQCAVSDGVNKTLEKQNRDEQVLISGCQSEALKLLAPVAMKITPVVFDQTSQGVVTRTVRWIVMTNKSLTPVHLNTICSQGMSEIYSVSVTILGGAM
jgi:hypothetical protein